QPLAFNLLLDDAARSQAIWNVQNTTLATFSHSGPGGNQPNDRMKAAGYTLAADDLNLENGHQSVRLTGQSQVAGRSAISILFRRHRQQRWRTRASHSHSR